MKHIAKKISCIALTAALLAGGMPVQVLADSPKTPAGAAGRGAATRSIAGRDTAGDS